jgi:hypothetical protein
MDRYGFRGKLTQLRPIGLTPAGLRLDVAFAGEVTDGPLTGATLEGVDYLLIRPDGIGVVDAFELAMPAGAPGVSLHAEGYIVPPFEMPELSVLADPGFAWPDVDLPMHGSSRVQTADPSTRTANHTVYGWTGFVNVARGVLEVQAHSLAAALAAPA